MAKYHVYSLPYPVTFKRDEELQAALDGKQFLDEDRMGTRQQIDFWHEKRATYVVACRFKVRVRN